MKEFTATEISRLHVMGWKFLPNGPNGYDWLKFGDGGTRIATGGDATWHDDVFTVTGEPI